MSIALLKSKITKGPDRMVGTLGPLLSSMLLSG